MASESILGYVERPGPLHRLNGVSKLILVIACVLGSIIGFDTRYLIAMMALSAVLWSLSHVRFRDLAVVLGIIGALMVLNNIFIFLFAPEHGTGIYGSRTLLIDGPWRWNLTSEQLLYQANVTLKYFAVLPPVLLFIATTKPSEFAASLNRVGIPYRTAYAVSIALRYIPDVQRDFVTISKAHQARGLDTSKAAPLRVRARNIVGVIVPLLMEAFDRIESVSSAMELRGFGQGKRRTWYHSRPLRGADVAVIALAVLVVATPIALIFINGGRYWNPFQ